MKIKKLSVPVLAPLLGGGTLGLATYLSAAGNEWSREMMAEVDLMITDGAVLDLMGIALTAGSLVLAVWGMIAARYSDLIAKIPDITPVKRAAVQHSIDGLLQASIAWFLSFSAFFIAYLAVLSLDDVVDIKTITLENGFSLPGFVNFMQLVGDEVLAPAFFLTGTLLLISGTWTTIASLNRLAPSLALVPPPEI